MEKIWLKHYHENVPAEINPDEFKSVVDVLQASCREYKTLPAFSSMGVTLTYHDICELAHAFSAYLQQALQLKKGDRVAIMLPNVLQYPVVMFGILRAGLIAVNINPLYTPTELVHQIRDSGAETIIVLANFAHTVAAALAETPLKNVIVTSIGDLFPWPKSMLVNFVVKYIKRMVKPYNIPNAIKFSDLLSKGRKCHFHSIDVGPEDIAFLQYTGGTTGVSKGAMLTHRNLVANILQAEAWFDPIFTHGKEIIITALPLYHIFSLMANCLFIMKVGGQNVLIINARDTNDLVKTMSKYKFTVITAVNTLFSSLLKNKDFAKLDFSHLILALGGGMAVQSTIAEKWQAVTGKPILEAYGLTETSPCAIINPHDIQKYNGTIGLPVSSTDIMILDEDGQEVPIGEPGELGIKGPQVMRGYWQNPEETEKVFTKDGWLLTGDVASIDKNGYVKILERKKDMIIVSGFNVYPNEIEDVLAGMPGVHEVAVVAVPNENSGEVPKAFIVRSNPDITAEDVIAYARTKLTGYKIPKHVKFVEELPKSNVGKVLRRKLRANEESA